MASTSVSIAGTTSDSTVYRYNVSDSRKSMGTANGYTLTIIIEGIGTTSPAGSAAPGTQYAFPADSYVFVEATLGDAPWAFTHWSGDIGNIKPTKWWLDLTMDQDRTVTAHFEPADWRLTVSYSGVGSIFPEPGTYAFADGSSFEVVANVTSGGEAFRGWTGDIPIESNPWQFDVYLLMDQDRNVHAEFVPGDFTLTIQNPTSATDIWYAPASGVYSYLAGRVAWTEVRPTPNAFWGGWLGDVRTSDLIHRFVMDGDKSMLPLVRATGQRLSVNTVGSGIVLATQAFQYYVRGTKVTLHASGSDGYLFSEWSGDVPSDANIHNPDLTVTMDRDRVLIATFVPPDWELKLQVSGHGATDPESGDYTYLNEDAVTVTGVPEYDAIFLRWEGDVPEDVNPTQQTITMTMDRSRTVTAVFVPARVQVPDLAGLTRESALEALSLAGFVVDDLIEVTSCLVKSDHVISQRPEPGLNAVYGSRVDLLISSGGCDPCRGAYHSADSNQDHRFQLSEILRAIQFYNSFGLHCAKNEEESEDGYRPGATTDHACCPHDGDYLPGGPDWQIGLGELLRMVQFFNLQSYGCDPMSEDGFSIIPGGCEVAEGNSVWQDADDGEGVQTEPEPPRPGHLAMFADIIFVWCPPGTFTMGTMMYDPAAQVEATPAHKVTLTEGFWISKYEITQGQWLRVLDLNTAYYVGDNQRPMENVSWIETQDFISALNEENPGMDFRLPTEAEWEYACRAGSSARYYWGEDFDHTLIDEYAWYDVNSWGRTHPVGGNISNAWGIHDMSGNVGEWVLDWLGAYSSEPMTNPTGPAEGVYRVVRGGAWGLADFAARSSYRSTYNRPEERYSYVGFRLVKP